MLTLLELLNQYNKQNDICKYLSWINIMPMILLNKDYSIIIEHPFIREAIKYYKIKDGIKLTREEATNILKKTRDLLGSELVETAILSNFIILSKTSKITFKEMENVLYDYNYNDINLTNVDLEITKSIELSRCSLYNSLHRQKEECDNFKVLSYDETIVAYEYEYNINILSGKYLNDDNQINLIVNKTNMPLAFSYIFLTRFIKQRKRQHYEKICF
jgi:hypothetical protein